ncbi:cation-translocating P-type ATPase [Oryzomonas sagensis]|uniref:Cation-translocating P-type ATPase n=1 Tax=Oryzomonas sagensis TaxID=2603857 RepID=A0ABQ6TMC7_9BACT|nr:cation-translocating P-type ATPase [Oryzomonas sagensis]KAB0669626.1 cation-translocating P-type ATPase [Oryzomonas sagensis]
MEWHLRDIATVLAEQKVDAACGLSSGEAACRLSRFGSNELRERGGTSPWLILWEQFTSTMALILTGAAFLSAFVGSFKDSLTILAIVCLFALLGFVQEYRAERAMRALKRLAVPVVRVRRNGMPVEIPAVDLVAGDIVLLEAGNLVPADCRVIEVYSLRVQEAVLTGEAEEVEKCVEALGTMDDPIPTGERVNMVFMGTTVAYGRGAAVVVATGMNTELGRIAGMLQDVAQEWTPLQKRLDRLGKILALAAVAVSLLFLAIGLLRGEDLRLMLMTAVSLAVAAIPEGLPAVVTITLAIGSQRMLKRHALIRKLPAVETLGSVTVICSDKTGTLTQNRMTVTEVVTSAEVLQQAAPQLDGAESEAEAARRGILACVALCNEAVLAEGEGQGVGDPTEIALLAAAAQEGLLRHELEARLPRVAETPFDSTVKRMVTFHTVGDAAVAASLGLPAPLNTGECLVVGKGALGAVLELCDRVGDQPLAAAERQAAMTAVDRLAGQGRRVLAVACGIGGRDTHAVHGLSLIGLVAMMDPLRPEARDAVELCRQAGIRPVMITGDHPLTARSIADGLGMGEGGRVMTGAELEHIGTAGLVAAGGEVSVYARVSPEHKLMIVDALQRQGQVVAMTGDGVNDAPALKKADIGVSMGITGTDVAREAADMVLLDDNFATIVSAVREGRTIYDNIRKFIEFSVAGNLGKILAVLTLPFLGLPSPLTPLQLLWLNLLTDGLLGLGMGVERSEPDVMARPPLSPTSQIFDRRMVRHTLLTGGIIGTSTILLTYHHWRFHPENWQTVLFTSLAFAQIGQAMALRSFRHSFFRMGLFGNPLLLSMVGLVILLQGMVVYLPAMQAFFKTTTLAAEALAWVFVPGIVLFAVLEVEKVVVRRVA